MSQTTKEPNVTQVPAQNGDHTLTATERDLERLWYRFDCVYAHWTAQARKTKNGVINKAPLSDLYVNAVEWDVVVLKDIYNAYQKIEIPTKDLCRRLEKSVQYTKDIVLKAHAQIQETEEAICNSTVVCEEETLPCSISSYGGSTCSMQNEKVKERKKVAQVSKQVKDPVLNGTGAPVAFNKKKRKATVQSLQAAVKKNPKYTAACCKDKPARKAPTKGPTRGQKKPKDVKVRKPGAPKRPMAAYMFISMKMWRRMAKKKYKESGGVATAPSKKEHIKRKRRLPSSNEDVQRKKRAKFKAQKKDLPPHVKFKEQRENLLLPVRVGDGKIGRPPD